MKAPEELLFEIDKLRIKYKGQKFDKEKGSPYIEKATELINQFKKEALLEFLYWWIPEIHSQDAHSQVNKFENHLLTKQ